MALQLRRVVTGHDANGRAVVKIDEVSKNVTSSRPGATACVILTTESFPVDNTGCSTFPRPFDHCCHQWSPEERGQGSAVSYRAGA